jgi:hypothetical protein
LRFRSKTPEIPGALAASDKKRPIREESKGWRALAFHPFLFSVPFLFGVSKREGFLQAI